MESINEIIEIVLEAFRKVVREELDLKSKSVKYYSRKEAVSYLGISLPTLDKLIFKGKIKSVKAGKRRLISENDLIEFGKSDKNLQGG